MSTPQPTPSQRLSRAATPAKSRPYPLSLSLSRRATVEKLSDNVLLNIFCYFLDDSPGYWPRLVHICHKWRCIVLASPQALHIRLFCTHGTPVLKTLHCWPTLSIIVQYGGLPNIDPPTPDDEENIVSALKQSDRVSSISLTVTSSLLEKLSAIEMIFPELEDLVLLSRDIVPLTLPSTFRWGPRLRCLHLTGIIFLSLLRPLYTSRDLVDLQLHEVLDPPNFSPEVLVDALSGMGQLRSLSLHFVFTTYHIDISPQSRKRVVLPALTCLNFRGVTQYLESLVARIDAPRLGDIEVTILNESIFELSKLNEFIDRIVRHRSHRQAEILFSESAISISWTHPGDSTSIKFHISCEPLIVQLSLLNQICIQFPTFLLNVEDLCIVATGQSQGGSRPWLGSLNPFTGVKRFHVAGSDSANIVRALQLPERQRDNVLPSLHTLLMSQPEPHLREAVVSVMVSRRLSGHPITVEYGPLCHISGAGKAGTISARTSTTTAH